MVRNLLEADDRRRFEHHSPPHRTLAAIARLEVVGAASNGREAVELFRRTQPDVVTMDLTMPEMDGIECVQELVALNSKVLILVVSALADKATAVEAIEKGGQRLSLQAVHRSPAQRRIARAALEA
jgi:chemotaxis response regulator CheB